MCQHFLPYLQIVFSHSFAVFQGNGKSLLCTFGTIHISIVPFKHSKSQWPMVSTAATINYQCFPIKELLLRLEDRVLTNFTFGTRLVLYWFKTTIPKSHPPLTMADGICRIRLPICSGETSITVAINGFWLMAGWWYLIDFSQLLLLILEALLNWPLGPVLFQHQHDAMASRARDVVTEHANELIGMVILKLTCWY